MGATYPKELEIIRNLVPSLPFLIPGIGHQKGDLAEVLNKSILDKPIILLNSSKGIIYASSKIGDYGQKARTKVLEINNEISKIYSF